jgi:pyruvate,water dikinase
MSGMDPKPYWTKVLSQEFWAGLVTPLMFSIAGSLIEERMVGRGLRVAGLKHIGNDRFLKLFWGHVYLNAKVLGEAVERIPSVVRTPALLRLLPDTVRGDLARTRVSFFSPRTLRILLRLFALERDWTPFSNYKAFCAAATGVEQLGRAYALLDMEALSDGELLEESRTLYRQMGDFLEVVIWGVLFAYVARPLTEHLARRWGQDTDGELAVCLRLGLDGIQTFEINREIEMLADEVVCHPALSALFDSYPPREILDRLGKEEWAQGFFETFEAFILRHGHRFLGRDIRHATWRERPDTLVEMIRLTRGSDLSRRNLELQRQRRAEAERILRNRIRQGPLGPARDVLFALVLSYDRKYFVLRENMRYLSDIFLEQFRRIYLEIGRRWQLSGSLQKAEDIFFLRREEIEEAYGTVSNVSSIVEQRKNEYRQAGTIRTPEVFREGEERAVESPLSEGRRTLLKGDVASPGHVSGPARVIREPADLLAFRKGEILVARCTDPSWAPVLPLAAGLVLEVGGVLCHGSIVAREYGIPALIRTEDALGSLRSGDFVELDTDRGCVRVVPQPLSP